MARHGVRGACRLLHVGEETLAPGLDMSHAVPYSSFDVVYRQDYFRETWRTKPSGTTLWWTDLGPGDSLPGQGSALAHRAGYWPLQVRRPLR